MIIFILWIVFTIVVCLAGSSRNIGFWGAFIVSLLLSPVVGLLFVLLSKDKEDEQPKNAND